MSENSKFEIDKNLQVFSENTLGKESSLSSQLHELQIFFIEQALTNSGIQIDASQVVRGFYFKDNQRQEILRRGLILTLPDGNDALILANGVVYSFDGKFDHGNTNTIDLLSLPTLLKRGHTSGLHVRKTLVSNPNSPSRHSFIGTNSKFDLKSIDARYDQNISIFRLSAGLNLHVVTLTDQDGRLIKGKEWESKKFIAELLDEIEELPE